MTKPCLSDEILIDKVLSNLSKEQEQGIRAHLDHCLHCQSRLEEWQHLLIKGEPQTVSWRYTAPKLKKRLKKYLFSTSNHKLPWGKPALLLLSVSLLFCLTLLTGIWSSPTPINLEDRHSPSGTPLAHDSHFLMNPQTTHYRFQHTFVLPVEEYRLPSTVQGNLWVDHKGQKLFLVLEGLSYLPEKDYQVWVITRKVANNAGLVKHNDSNAFLYWYSEEPTEIEMIRVSIEPKGGSIYPTGPEAFTIFLKQ